MAEEVHHKIELTPENINNKRIALGMDNLVSLCGQCHKRITKAEHEKSNTGSVKLQRIVFDENGYPVKPPPGVRQIWGGCSDRGRPIDVTHREKFA